MVKYDVLLPVLAKRIINKTESNRKRKRKKKKKKKDKKRYFLISVTPCEIFSVCSDLTRVECKMKA